MKTKTFTRLVEEAFEVAYGQKSNFDTVPYIPEEGGEMMECLGIFILPEQQMAVISAQALQILCGSYLDYADGDQNMEDAMAEFTVIVHGMLVAPYMQWYCAYFPKLTADQVLAESEAGDKPALDMGTEIGNGTFPTVDGRMENPAVHAVRKELDGMLEITEIDVARHTAAMAWIDGHNAEVLDFRNNGMRVSEIADTVLSLSQ